MSRTPKAKRVERFWSFVDQRGDDECWPWTGQPNTSGYGQFRLDDRLYVVHRIAYELLVGPIPKGLRLDHTCHNRDSACRAAAACPHRRCCNPAHLEPVTHVVNCRRGRSGQQFRELTHCAKGHPFEGANLRIVVSTRRGTSYRQCVICRRETNRRSAERKRVARSAA